FSHMQFEYQAYSRAKSKHSSDLIPDIRLLWKALNTERADSLAGYFRKPALRRAYLGYYLPLYVSKIASLLESLPISWEKPSILDLGAGPLSATWAAQRVYGQLGECMAVDREIGAMRSGFEFVEELTGQRTPVRLVQANLKGPTYFWKPSFKPDLVIMAHVLNEFGSGARHLEAKLSLIESAMALLGSQGVLLIVEPAARVMARDLMALRDQIMAQGEYRILAPCPQIDRCPLLVNRENWCHRELKVERSAELKKVDQTIGFDREFLKCSYLVLARRDYEQKASHERVVSGLMTAKGIHRRYVCTPEGLLTAAERVEPGHAILRDLMRGDAVQMQKWSKNLVKISKES
ncbi:MAG: hypothetical protein I8H72_05915, partial [Myxococcaceae bacterium]|nr:hypothetical protein [Myxococcaceae bacterium]